MTISSSATILNKINQDSTVLVTSQQLKETNLIFLEHKKLLTENNLLYQQLENYQLKIKSLEKIDSLRILQLSEYRSSFTTQVQSLNQKIDSQKKTILMWKIGGIAISSSLLLLFLLK